MDSLKTGSLLITSVLQSKAALLVCFPPFLFSLYLALPLLESSFLTTIWLEVSGIFEGSVFAFLLLNCVTVTIIASSKLGKEKRGFEEKSQEQLMFSAVGEQGEREKYKVPEQVPEQALVHTFDAPLEEHVERGNHEILQHVAEKPLNILNTPLENGCEIGDKATESVVASTSLFTPDSQLRNRHGKKEKIVESVAGPSVQEPLRTVPDYCKKKEANPLRRSWSVNASSDVYKAKHGQVQLKPTVKERKHVIKGRDRRVGRKDDNLVSLHPDPRKKKPIISSHKFDGESTHSERPTLKANKSHKSQVSDTAPPAAAGDHPSMDEVWAAITASKKRGNSMQEEGRSSRREAKPSEKPPWGAAASKQKMQATAAGLALPAAASGIRRAPAAINIKLLKTGEAAANLTAKTAATGKRADGGKAEENAGEEVDTLNRRAELFIGRFNNQMRLQRQESMQRQEGGCRPRDLMSNGVRHVPRQAVHLRPAGRGLLVG